MTHCAKLLSRLLVAPTIAAAAIVVGTSCTDDGGPVSPGPAAVAPRIHILLRGEPADSVLRVGAFGAIAFSLAEEGAAGGLTPVTGRRIVWGSTFPSVAEVAVGADNGYAVVRGNGRARVIAELDGRRDTVTLEVAQLAVAAHMVGDTLVALTPDAIDLAGAATVPTPLRFSVIRVDSNGYVAPGTVELQYSVPPESPFAVIANDDGTDGGQLIGIRPGEGELVVRHGSKTDTVLVQVAGAFRVVRLVETPSGALRVFPDTARISRGAAVIFQNEASFTTSVASSSVVTTSWRAGPIPTNGREAQLFTEPAVYTYGWGGTPRAIVVTP